ncbi:MAG TPA: sulfatase [bacterium]|nr:sulfatase [bacterium]
MDIPTTPVVIFIVVDAMRADALGAYGAPEDPSPNIDSLAHEGAIFTHAYTSAPFTMTSVATIFTGLYPWQHRVLFSEGGGLYLDKSVPSLVQKFREAGYYTAAFSGTYFLFSRNGFAQGFDHFDETCASSFFRDSADCINSRVGEWLYSGGGDMLSAGGNPLFIYIHYVDTHAPYYAPEPHRHRFTEDLAKPPRDDTALGEVKQFTGDRPWYQFYLKPSPSDVTYLRGMYEGEVSYVDAKIGELLQMFGDVERLVLITADHGEAFNEHGRMEHVEDLHDQVMRVPFIMSSRRSPFKLRKVPQGKRIDDAVRTMDMMPTLLDLAGIEVPHGISGRSLVALMNGDKLLSAPAAALHFPDNKPEYTLVLWPWKLFSRPESKSFELYRLDTDPGELHDLSASRPQALSDMKAILDSIISLPAPSSANPAPAMDQDTMKRLNALGY